MAERVTYVPRPYVRTPHVADTRTLGDLMRRQADVGAQGALLRGQSAGDMWRTIAQAFGGYQQIEREKEQFAAAQTIREQERQAAEALKREEMAARKLEREEADRIRQETRDQAAATYAAESIGEGPVSRFQADILARFPGTAARLRGQQTLPARVTPGAMGEISQEPEVFPVLEPTPAMTRQKALDASLMADREETNRRLAQPKPPAPPSVGSFEDYVTTKYGPRPTPQQIEQARRVYTDQGRQAAAPQPPGTLAPNVQRRVDMKVRAFEAQPAVKKAQTMADSIGFAQSLDPNTKNPADDQALIYAFAKAMDPESVVREGEYATVQKYAQSWAQSMGFNAQRIFSNTTFLTPEARQNMKATIMSRFESARKQYDAVRKSYADQIGQITGTGDADSYLTDYGAAFPTTPTKKNPNR